MIWLKQIEKLNINRESMHNQYGFHHFPAAMNNETRILKYMYILYSPRLILKFLVRRKKESANTLRLSSIRQFLYASQFGSDFVKEMKNLYYKLTEK